MNRPDAEAEKMASFTKDALDLIKDGLREKDAEWNVRYEAALDLLQARLTGDQTLYVWHHKVRGLLVDAGRTP